MTTVVPDPDAFAALLCDWSMSVGPGDRIGILSTTLAADLAAALNRAVLDRDAWPFVALEPPGAGADLYRHAQARHRTDPPPTQMAMANASLASQSTGPILSDTEMSCTNRAFADVGRRLLAPTEY